MDQGDETDIPKFVQNFFHTKEEPKEPAKPKAIYMSEGDIIFNLYDGGKALPAKERQVKRLTEK